MTSKMTRFDYRPINADRLHDEMGDALGDKYVSMNTSDEGIFLLVTDDATDADEVIAKSVLDNHNPALLSRAQTFQKERADSFLRVVDKDLDALRGQPGIPPWALELIDLLADVQKILRVDTGMPIKKFAAPVERPATQVARIETKADNWNSD